MLLKSFFNGLGMFTSKILPQPGYTIISYLARGLLSFRRFSRPCSSLGTRAMSASSFIPMLMRPKQQERRASNTSAHYSRMSDWIWISNILDTDKSDQFYIYSRSKTWSFGPGQSSIALPVRIAVCFVVLDYWSIGVLAKANTTNFNLNWSFHSSIVPADRCKRRKIIEAPSGGSPKPGPLGPDSLLPFSQL